MVPSFPKKFQAGIKYPAMKPILSALLIVAASASASADAAAVPARPAPPNVVVIFMDDMGYADIAPFGAEVKTPNLNRLAVEGTKFTSFYSAQAVCSASRTGLLTGCYPNRVGITGALGPHSKTGIAAEEMTLGELCKQINYATAIFGKWHLGDAREFLPLQNGFDEYFGLPYSNDMTPHRKAGIVKNYPNLPLLRQNTVVNPDVDAAAQDQLTTWYTEHAVDFIRRHKDKPFFLYVPHAMMHVPLHVSDKFRGKSGKGLYADTVMEVDWSVGQILDALKENGIDNNTLVVFTSDNGPWLCYGDHSGSAHPLREGKGTSWDGGVRVPTLMRWPGKIPAGRVCDAPLMTIDIFPTVAKFIGAPLPGRKIDGLDISTVITGKTNQSPHDVLYFYYHKNDLESLRCGNWKLELPHAYNSLEGKPGGRNGKSIPYARKHITRPELYDLGTDPGQDHDIAATHPAVMEKLLAHADHIRADLGDDLAKKTGPGRRQPGKTTALSVFPSQPEFPRMVDPKYCPGTR